MALTAAETNFISRSSNAAKTVLDLYGQLVQLDALWAGAPTYKTTITQGDLDSVSAYTESGLTSSSSGTVGTLPDGEFALAAIKTTITNALPSLTVLANLP